MAMPIETSDDREVAVTESVFARMADAGSDEPDASDRLAKSRRPDPTELDLAIAEVFDRS